MSPSLDRPRTGKSISVAFAFALRACVRAKLRERDNAFQWLGLILCDFPGLRSVRPVRLSGRSPVQLSFLASLAGLADPFSLGLLMPIKNYFLQTFFFRIVNAH